MKSKKSITITRVLMGFVFLIFGFDGILHFFPLPPMPEAAVVFMGVLISSKLFYAIKALEILCGLLFLSGYFVPLASALILPILFNIIWFDMMLAPNGLPVGILLIILEGILIWNYWPKFKPLFDIK